MLSIRGQAPCTVGMERPGFSCAGMSKTANTMKDGQEVSRGSALVDRLHSDADEQADWLTTPLAEDLTGQSAPALHPGNLGKRHPGTSGIL